MSRAVNEGESQANPFPIPGADGMTDAYLDTSFMLQTGAAGSTQNFASWTVSQKTMGTIWAQNGHTAKLRYFQRFRAGVIPASGEKQ